VLSEYTKCFSIKSEFQPVFTGFSANILPNNFVYSLSRHFLRRSLVEPALPTPSVAPNAQPASGVANLLGKPIGGGRRGGGRHGKGGVMWARVVEVMLGCWLAVSPFVFRHPAEERAWWANDLICALLVVALALLSVWPPL